MQNLGDRYVRMVIRIPFLTEMFINNKNEGNGTNKVTSKKKELTCVNIK